MEAFNLHDLLSGRIRVSFTVLKSNSFEDVSYGTVINDEMIKSVPTH